VLNLPVFRDSNGIQIFVKFKFSKTKFSELLFTSWQSEALTELLQHPAETLLLVGLIPEEFIILEFRQSVYASESVYASDSPTAELRF